MTYEEAIEAIKCNYPPSNYSILREALDLAMETMGKQIPKKPLLNEYCSFCGSLCIGRKGYRHNFCKKCGQKVDWSDGEV